MPNYSSCTQPRGLLPSGALVALPIVKNQRKKRRKLTWLNRESGVDAEAVRSTKGTGIVRSTDGAAVAGALVPATLAAAPAPGKGYFDWSSCSVRLDVISTTGVGEAVGCWLLIEKAREIIEEGSV